MSDINTQALQLHRQHQGKIEIKLRVPLQDRHDLSLAYTPGVAEPCRVIAQDPTQSFDLTWRGRTVAVVSDGSAVLGLGNIGAAAGLPVMEGKAALLKQFGGVDAVPLVIDTQDTDEIVRFVQQIAPSFAGINLEDIAAPRCFEIEERLQDIGIPVFHDDQHGTAIVVSAALQNAAKVVGKPYASLRVVIMGAGSAGWAIAQTLLGLACSSTKCERLSKAVTVRDVILVDRCGAINQKRSDLGHYKKLMAAYTNQDKKSGSLAEVIRGADVVIGVSGPKLITAAMIQSMASQPIVFAMANPTPEIMPEEAKAAGAAVVASGRSDYPNQINNVLAFPAIFRAVIDGRLSRITLAHQQAASQALAKLVPKPTAEKIIPDPFTPNLAKKVAAAILKAA